MEFRGTHIHHLSDDVLISIFWPSEQSKSYTSESDRLWSSLSLKPKYIYNAFPEDSLWRTESSMPILPASADAAHSLLIASICRRWRRLAQSHVSSLFVKKYRTVSRQDILNAVACFPNLTHLHLSYRSVEAADNTFLADLASSCPGLRALHVGELMLFKGNERHGRKAACLIGKSDLDHLARHCPQLEQLSLEWLEEYVNPPASLFQLPLRTLMLGNNAFVLDAPGLSSLSSLTALTIENRVLRYDQLSSLRHLTNLVHISLPSNMSTNSEDHLDFSLAQLPCLESLRFGLWFTQFDAVFPLEFPHRFLKRLQLHHCYHQERLPDSIGDVLPSLVELSISDCETFSDLTDEFTSLTCLESLTISSCSVYILPENFGNLPALKTLVLNRLPLLSLPASFTRLGSLETFFLLGCEAVYDLPAGFGCLTTLQTLSLVCSWYLDLPEDIGGLTNLQNFRLEKNCTEQLPSSFTQLASLTRLEVDGCRVGGLPEGVGTMARLQELYILDCPDISELPDSVTSLVSLRVLMVIKCPFLSSVPRRLDSLTRLRQLELRGCALLNEAPEALPLSLQALTYDNNQQMVFLPNISRLTELRKLHLGFVGARCLLAISYHLSALEHLELALEEVAGEFLFALTRLSRLRTLTIKEVRSLKKLVECGGATLLELRQLNIYSMCDELTNLPAAITTLHHLTSMQIHAPKLFFLLDSIGALSRLRKLDLSDCSSLRHLPDSLSQLSCLHNLTLSNTPIRSLPSGLAQLRRLSRHALSGAMGGWEQRSGEERCREGGEGRSTHFTNSHNDRKAESQEKGVMDSLAPVTRAFSTIALPFVRRPHFQPSLPSIRLPPFRSSPSLPRVALLVSLPFARTLSSARCSTFHASPSHPNVAPVTIPSARRPPFRPSPSLSHVAHPSARRPPFRPSLSLPPVAHPSVRRSPFRRSPTIPSVALPSARRLPFVSSPFLPLVPSQSPSSSLPVALAIPPVSLPMVHTCHPSLLSPIPFPASPHPLPYFLPSPSLLPPIPFPASPHPLPFFPPSPSLFPPIPFPASPHPLPCFPPTLALLSSNPFSASPNPVPCFPPSRSLLPPILFPASPHPLPSFPPSPSLLPPIPFPPSPHPLPCSPVSHSLLPPIPFPPSPHPLPCFPPSPSLLLPFSLFPVSVLAISLNLLSPTLCTASSLPLPCFPSSSALPFLHPLPSLPLILFPPFPSSSVLLPSSSPTLSPVHFTACPLYHLKSFPSHPRAGVAEGVRGVEHVGGAA
ncbi:unnamed protein product [Closterium sp. NIES-65]|nr:unnamed protein product [Closterium sp. NIES-65]